MTDKKSSVSTATMTAQTQALRQDVNSQPMKPAVVIGKIDLKPRREVVIQKPRPAQRQAPEPRQERPKQMKRSDDNRAATSGNQAMLAELQYVKKQLREVQEKYNTKVLASTVIALETKTVLELILAGSSLELIKDSEAFRVLQGHLKPATPLLPLETIKEIAAQDDIVAAIVEARGVKL